MIAAHSGGYMQCTDGERIDVMNVLNDFFCSFRVYHVFNAFFILPTILIFKLKIRSVERGICPIGTLYSLAAVYSINRVGANRAQLSVTRAEL